jgi:hypothetical protein
MHSCTKESSLYAGGGMGIPHTRSKNCRELGEESRLGESMEAINGLWRAPIIDCCRYEPSSRC